MDKKLNPTKYMTTLALLVAVSVVVSILESMIPPIVPVPGVKMGLSNIIILWTMYSFSNRSAFMVLIARILITSIFAGQMTGMIYSLSGGIMCFFAMSVLKKFLSVKYMVIVSVFGALFHNLGQLIAANFVLNGAVWYYGPYLVISAMVSGAFTGLCAYYLKKHIIMGDKNEGI